MKAQYVHCCLCGDRIKTNSATRSSRTMANNLILLSAMKNYTNINEETLKRCFTQFSKTRKYMCTHHFVNAAQYILDDVLKAGGTLSQVKNGNFILNGVPVFVSKKLNSATTSFADEVLISSNDVITFENYYMDRYCDNGCWNIPEAHPKKIKKERESHIKEEDTHIEAIMLMEDKAGTSDASNDANEATNDFFIPGEQAESTADSEKPLELSETDPALLNKVFCVQGKELLELFRLSRCGCEENSAGRVRLIEKDSAPVILYVSTGKEPEVKRWKGQLRFFAFRYIFIRNFARNSPWYHPTYSALQHVRPAFPLPPIFVAMERCCFHNGMTKTLTLKDVGYHFNEKGEVRSLKDDSPFVFTNQADYDRIGNAMTNEVYGLLESQCGLKKIEIPMKVEDTDGKAVDHCSFVFASPDFLQKSTIVLIIHGMGAVRPGQWSRRLILNESLDVGSQIPYIQRTIKNDWGVIVCNTNTNEDFRDYARRHICAVYDQLLKDSSGQRIFVIAHSRGGPDFASSLPYFQNENRFEVVCLTDSVDFEIPRCSSTEYSSGGTVFINWKANSKLQGTAISDEDVLDIYSRVHQLYAGTTEHERSSHAAFESVFHLLEHWKNSESLAKLLVEAAGLTSAGVTEQTEET